MVSLVTANRGGAEDAEVFNAETADIAET